MKKWGFIALTLILTGIVCIYFFIPATLKISTVQYLPIPYKAACRSFNNLNTKKYLFPASINKKQTFSFNNFSFIIGVQNELSQQQILIITASDTIYTQLNTEALKNDSCIMVWRCNLKTSYSPFNKIRQYLKAVSIKKTIDNVLANFARVVITNNYVYGMAIKKTTVVDSILITEKKQFTCIPTTIDVYKMLNGIKTYIQQHQAISTNLPMVNIMKTEDSNYTAMVAIPINKKIKEDELRKLKFVLYGGHLIMAEVKGGYGVINNGFKQLELYKEDYELMSPAIPYQSVITDRSKIADTALWITRIYYPVY